jgi:hypothetical protein
LNVNDIVYFSGLIEGFGEFCHEHGLELVTNESLEAAAIAQDPTDDAATFPLMSSSVDDGDVIVSSDDEERLRRINLMTGKTRMASFSFSSLRPITHFIDALFHCRHYPRSSSSRIHEA